MVGLAQAGAAITPTQSNSNAIQAVVPIGLAAQGENVWSGGAPATPYQLVSTNYAQSYNNPIVTGPIDTTGATLIVLTYVGYRWSTGASDNQGNVYSTDAYQPDSNFAPQTQIFYCFKPATNTNTVISLTNTSYGTLTVMTFKGGNKFTTDGPGTTTGKVTAATTTIQLPPLTPSQPNALLVLCAGSNGDYTTQSVDSGFTITLAAPGNYQTGGTAILIQTTAAATSPTWNFGADIGGAAYGVLQAFL